ncbi:MAG: hypothetical protein JWL63_3204 [Rhodocyclales bacterium]|nr:hypothetical protein [Rhodocyclales bacterium]
MENQHKHITGYRDLSKAEIDAMNEIKSKGNELDTLIEKLRLIDGVDQRAIAIAKTELQTGIMWLTRAVAKPQSF